ncbi:hypothetical protein PWR05_33885, partial [Paraburkholderia sp. A2RI-6]|uniref:hypothetical protein n=1 Tax=Paraburkholderia sp. A2RI-6 TaxID=3028371 RepID=UPI003B7766B0
MPQWIRRPGSRELARCWHDHWRYHLRFPVKSRARRILRMASHDDYLKKVLTARVYDVARETELERA